MWEWFTSNGTTSGARRVLAAAVVAAGFLSKERFESGRGIQLEVLDAQVVVTRARFNAVNALAESAGARAMWLRAIGQVR